MVNNKIQNIKYQLDAACLISKAQKSEFLFDFFLKV